MQLLLAYGVGEKKEKRREISEDYCSLKLF